MALSEMLLALVDESGEAHGYGIHARLIEVFPGAAACERAEVYAVLRRLEKGGVPRFFLDLGEESSPSTTIPLT